MFYDQDHLVITKRLTTDGSRLALDERGRPIEKVTLAPMSAKKHFQKRNEALPNDLKLKIEEVRVSSYQAPAPVVEVPVEEKAAAKVPKPAAPVSNLPKGVTPPPEIKL